ncbi:MAG: hypothetical protein KDJ19_01125 [Hyphomicrobiaceae bacterium]|nr:hypothetical protein [Hyphomicrobiaceae bacterium]MCC0022873.1 hypothetical protein [Hyphomicrobiaceae bacterium]
MKKTSEKPENDKGDEVLKRMLKTPPRPNKKGDGRSRRPSVTSEEDRQNGRDAEKA